jgi:hypothetical protein
MTQTMYAHMNKIKIKKNKQKTSSLYLGNADAFQGLWVAHPISDTLVLMDFFLQEALECLLDTLETPLNKVGILCIIK